MKKALFITALLGVLLFACNPYVPPEPIDVAKTYILPIDSEGAPVTQFETYIVMKKENGKTDTGYVVVTSMLIDVGILQMDTIFCDGTSSGYEIECNQPDTIRGYVCVTVRDIQTNQIVSYSDTAHYWIKP